ncbi:MAG: peptide chain release factor N(5)-glutamine methyltransferase [Bacteroidia bacterium]|nr:peptide chain release factor N(5)-glutamine methyltransferase [Bacteroidia bacterium]
MNNLLTSIRQSLDSIYSKDEAKALSMMICCDVLGLSATDLYMGKDINLSESKQAELENILLRLQKNEPIQYIQGVTEFCGRRFYVAPGVLIPRPETAELVELVALENPSCERLLDIGTGSGCIAVTLDLMLPQAVVEAWDISSAALAIARRNNESLKGKVSFRLQDVLQDPLVTETRYDVIVSNPPYIADSEKRVMTPNVLEWEPASALFVPDTDPLLFYRRIAALGRELLTPHGRLYFEINQAYGAETVELLVSYQYHNIRLIKDFYQNDRIIVAEK